MLARTRERRPPAARCAVRTALGESRASGWSRLPLTSVEPRLVGRQVKPFLVAEREDAPNEGPESLRSRAYAKDYNEVKSIGALNSTTRTADQTKAAIFWQTAPGFLWGELLDQLATKFSLDTADRARLYAIAWVAHGGRGDRVLERQVPLQVLAADRRDPARRHRRQPSDHGGPRVAARCSTQRRRRSRRWRRRTSRITRPGTAASPARSCPPCRTSSARTGSSPTSGARATPGSRGTSNASHAVAEGDRRRPRLGRHPLPDRGRAGRRDRQGGRAAGRRSTTSRRLRLTLAQPKRAARFCERRRGRRPGPGAAVCLRAPGASKLPSRTDASDRSRGRRGTGRPRARAPRPRRSRAGADRRTPRRARPR